MKRKILTLIVAAALMIVNIPIGFLDNNQFTVSAETLDEVPDGYTGIYTIADLYGIRNNMSGNYILMNDIDLSETAPGGDWDSGNGWKPIGCSSDESSFIGIFDGNGHVITNMHIYGTISDDVIGLFGSCDGDIIRTAVVNCDIDITVPRGQGVLVGAICGENNSYIRKCYANGKINVKIDSKANSNYYYNYYIGGIAGHSGAQNSFNVCDISVEIDDSTDSSIKNLNNFYIAGISGYKAGIYSSDQKYLTYLYNVGSVKISTNENFSGNCYFGSIAPYPSVSNGYTKCCYYLNSCSEYPAFSDYFNSHSYSTFSNISSLTEGQMKYSSTFTGFDFDKIWTIDSNAEYPYPTLKEVPYVCLNSDILLSGDINGDGEITSGDALNILQAVTNITELTDEQKELADLDSDGEITSTDALIVLQAVVGTVELSQQMH